MIQDVIAGCNEIGQADAELMLGFRMRNRIFMILETKKKRIKEDDILKSCRQRNANVLQ